MSVKEQHGVSAVKRARVCAVRVTLLVQHLNSIIVPFGNVYKTLRVERNSHRQLKLSVRTSRRSEFVHLVASLYQHADAQLVYAPL